MEIAKDRVGEIILYYNVTARTDEGKSILLQRT